MREASRQLLLPPPQLQLLLPHLVLLLLLQLPASTVGYSVRSSLSLNFFPTDQSSKPASPLLSRRNLSKGDSQRFSGPSSALKSVNLLSRGGESNAGPPAVSPEALQRVEDLVKKNKLFVLLKGTPDEPQCGFSRVTVQALQACGVEKIPYFDVLSDPELREAAKVFGQWQTFPQVYVNQELIGGCDIILEMFRNQSLHQLLKDHNLVEPANPEPQSTGA
ncbi:PKC-interacting cousin of thioredoxin, putative [Eimeria necatrix]|uniref:PKC-interacting cousin of thioredoxin, putative n=1 Tax=Eimeria necatrix TaxID=51315 RepID=U6N4C5_9EIME|nr:PKC-interacting cousin of thioredoxin, putative [Eimeria necatrix]CDJ69555.1 PKC-interacting cousin of thioredoxin, putative [Eimeria necatrix]